MQIQGANNFLLSLQPICFRNPFREVSSLLPLYKLQSSRDWFLKFRAAKTKHCSCPKSAPPPHLQQQSSLQHYLVTFPISPPPPPLPGSPFLEGVSGSPCARRPLSLLPMPPPCSHLPPLTSLQATEVRSSCSPTSAACRLSSVNLV